MRNTFKKTTLSLALATGLIGSAVWSTAAQACAAEPFVGSVCIMATAGSRGIDGYSLAQGQQMSINQYQILYSIVGVTWGGNATTYFNLPNLSGRVAVGSGTYSDSSGTIIYQAGQTGGARAVALNINNLPMHNHGFSAANVDFSKATATTTLSGLTTTTNLANVPFTSSSSSLSIKALNGAAASGNPTTSSTLANLSVLGAKIYGIGTPDTVMQAGTVVGTVSGTLSGTAPGTATGTATTTLGGTASVSGSTAVTGANAPSSVMQPYLVMNYYIATSGIYPPQP